MAYLMKGGAGMPWCSRATTTNVRGQEGVDSLVGSKARVADTGNTVAAFFHVATQRPEH